MPKSTQIRNFMFLRTHTHRCDLQLANAEWKWKTIRDSIKMSLWNIPRHSFAPGKKPPPAIKKIKEIRSLAIVLHKCEQRQGEIGECLMEQFSTMIFREGISIASKFSLMDFCLFDSQLRHFELYTWASGMQHGLTIRWICWEWFEVALRITSHLYTLQCSAFCLQ